MCNYDLKQLVNYCVLIVSFLSLKDFTKKANWVLNFTTENVEFIPFYFVSSTSLYAVEQCMTYKRRKHEGLEELIPSPFKIKSTVLPKFSMLFQSFKIFIFSPTELKLFI